MRLCRHCDSIMAECDPECPRCGRDPQLDHHWEGPRRRRFSLRRVVNEWLELSGRKKGRKTLPARAFRLLLARYILAVFAAVLLAIGAFQPIIRITSLGAYNLLHLADFLALLGSVVTFKGPVFIFAYLGGATLIAALLALVSAFMRWNAGIDCARVLSACIVMLIIGGYYFGLGSCTRLPQQLDHAFALHGHVLIMPAHAGMLFLLLGVLVLHIAHWWNTRAAVARHPLQSWIGRG